MMLEMSEGRGDTVKMLVWDFTLNILVLPGRSSVILCHFWQWQWAGNPSLSDLVNVAKPWVVGPLWENIELGYYITSL